MLLNKKESKEKLANEVFDVLVKHIGVRESERKSFVFYFGTPEYRIGGKLGFGGKFKATDERLYVDCYPEDLTPKRKRAINKANKSLAKISESSLAKKH